MKTILIIEDEKSIAELERDYLEIDGFKVEIALTGREGLEMALNLEVDLVLLDLMLPGIDGFQICKSIRSRKNIPILMVTAKKEDYDKIRGLGIGADDYIVKPFSTEHLTHALTSILKPEMQNHIFSNYHYFINNKFVPFTAQS